MMDDWIPSATLNVGVEYDVIFNSINISKGREKKPLCDYPKREYLVGCIDVHTNKLANKQ